MGGRRWCSLLASVYEECNPKVKADTVSKSSVDPFFALFLYEMLFQITETLKFRSRGVRS